MPKHSHAYYANQAAKHPTATNVVVSGSGNQNIGYTPVAITGTAVTSGGLGEPTGTIFGTESPNLDGYIDADPFGGGGSIVMATGNTQSTVNQSVPNIGSFFGSNPNANPNLDGNGGVDTNGTANPASATDQQISLNSQSIQMYAIWGAVAVAALFIFMKYRKG